MATMYVLSDARGEVFRMTLAGRSVTTQTGALHVVQSFPTIRAAAAHLDNVAHKRQREGYSVMGVSSLPDDALGPLGDPFSTYVSWRICRDRTEITFITRPLPRRIADRVAERIAFEAPQRLHLLCDNASPGRYLAHALSKRVLPSVRTFVFDTWYESVPRQWKNRLGNIDDVLWALPNVEHVLLSGDVQLCKTRHERLRGLYLFGDPLSQAAIEALGGSGFPSLERITLSGAGRAKHDLPRAIVAALRSIDAPRLSFVHIDQVPDVARFLDVLAKGGLPPAWDRVRLDGTIVDEDALLDVLRRRRAALSSLGALLLPLGNDVSLGAQAEAADIVPAIQDGGEPLDLRTPTDREMDAR